MASQEGTPSYTSQSTQTPRPKTGGRPRANLDDHKDQIIALYNAKTPWTKIEAILLAEHGIKTQGRTITRRMKEDWGVVFRRVETDPAQKDQLKARIAALWADRETRPKDDAELHARLRAEGFTVSLGAIHGLRKEIRLFRRWDEKLGRVRPDEEVALRRGRPRKRRPQLHSAYTDAQLVPPGGPEDDAEGDSEEDESNSEQPPAEPTKDGFYPGLTLPKPKPRKNARKQKSVSAQPSQPSQPSQPEHTPQNAQPRRSASTQPAPFSPLAPQQAPPQATATLSETDKDM